MSPSERATRFIELSRVGEPWLVAKRLTLWLGVAAFPAGGVVLLTVETRWPLLAAVPAGTFLLVLFAIDFLLQRLDREAFRLVDGDRLAWRAVERRPIEVGERVLGLVATAVGPDRIVFRVWPTPWIGSLEMAPFLVCVLVAMWLGRESVAPAGMALGVVLSAGLFGVTLWLDLRRPRHIELSAGECVWRSILASRGFTMGPGAGVLRSPRATGGASSARRAPSVHVRAPDRRWWRVAPWQADNFRRSRSVLARRLASQISRVTGIPARTPGRY